MQVEKLSYSENQFHSTVQCLTQIHITYSLRSLVHSIIFAVNFSWIPFIGMSVIHDRSHRGTTACTTCAARMKAVTSKALVKITTHYKTAFKSKACTLANLACVTLTVTWWPWYTNVRCDFGWCNYIPKWTKSRISGVITWQTDIDGRPQTYHHFTTWVVITTEEMHLAKTKQHLKFPEMLQVLLIININFWWWREHTSSCDNPGDS